MEAEYTPPVLTVDSVIFRLIDHQLNVLLIKRAREPFLGQWALPGGYNNRGETTYEALHRINKQKTGVDVSKMELTEQLYTFDTVARDPRGHAVSVSYMGLGRTVEPTISPSTEQPTFWQVASLPELAYDHAEIINYAHQRLSSKVTYTNAVFALLPELFTLTHLQKAYEAIFGRELDKRNFRKKFLDLELVEPTDKKFSEGAHRPALLYRFKQQKLQILSRSFD